MASVSSLRSLHALLWRHMRVEEIISFEQSQIDLQEIVDSTENCQREVHAGPPKSLYLQKGN